MVYIFVFHQKETLVCPMYILILLLSSYLYYNIFYYDNQASEDRYPYKYVCASFRNRSSTRVGKIQVMKVIVLIVIVITMYGCGWKPKVSCNVNDMNTAISDCKEQPQFAISKEF